MVDVASVIEACYKDWGRFAQYRCRELKIMSYSEDILHDAIVELLLKIDTLSLGEEHLRNYIFRAIKNRTIDAKRARRALFDVDAQYDDVPAGTGYYCSWDEMSGDDFAQFRECSCYTRPDDFIVPVKNGFYITPKEGWISGWVHSYKTKGRRYTYWQYSAFAGSRCKGCIPKRIKTSTSRHEAYVGLMKHNIQLASAYSAPRANEI